MRLTLARLYQARWSAKVHEEWVRAVLRDNPGVPMSRLRDLRNAMDEQAQDAVVTDYEGLIESLTLPDPDDRHVLAAAIVGHAEIIVTCNLRDFPDHVLDPYNIEAQHPDEFILQLVEIAPDVVLEAAEMHRRSLKNPPKSSEEFLVLLEAQGLPKSVAILRTLFQLATEPES